MTVERTAKVNALLRSVDLGIDARKPLSDTKITRGLPLARRRRGPRRRHRPCGGSPARQAHHRPRRRAQGQPNPHHRAHRGQPPPRPFSRRPASVPSPPPYGVVAFGPGAFRGRLRSPRRCEPHPRILGEHRAPPAQPRRRQAPELRTAHGHRRPHRPRPPRLRRTPQGRRKNPTGNPAMPQALPRPPPLPHPQR